MINNLSLKSKMVYKKLSDDLSRNIFKYRTLYNFTGDTLYMRKLVETSPSGKLLLDELNLAIARGDKICIFGAGIWGRIIKDNYSDINFFCFIDNHPCCENIGGVPVFEFEYWLKNYKDTTIVISSKLYQKEIYKQLLDHGISKKQIINAGAYEMQDIMAQYFDLPELENNREENEIFLDAGAFDGLTSEIFINWGGRRVIAFEPEAANRKKCDENLKSLGCEYKVYPFGLWSGKGTLSFASNLKGSSHILDKNQTSDYLTQIEVEALDNLIDEKITFLKMDIEGAELEALKGAENLIKMYKPKLAIAIYHKPEDIYIIPDFLLSLVPNYRFWLRHYSIASVDTVLYGICKDK